MDKIVSKGLELRDCKCSKDMLQKNGWQNWNLHQLSHFWPRLSGMEEDNMVRMVRSELARDPGNIERVFSNYRPSEGRSAVDQLRGLCRPGMEG